MPRPTLKDVAASSGYSLATVAFIMRGHPKPFPEATRATVLAAAAKLGYRANASARATRSGRMGALALVQIEEDLHGDMAWSTLDGIIKAVEDGGDHLIITKLPGAAFDDPAMTPKILQQLVVDGLLLSYHTAAPAPLASAIRALKVPAVWINSRLPRDCVYLDDRAAAARAVKRLQRAGHRRIAYVNLWQAAGKDAAAQHYSMLDRFAGYHDAMAGRGFEPRVLVGGAGESDVDARCVEALAGATPPTALVLYHASMAPPFLIAAARLGLAVPRDLSLVTFSDRQDVFGGLRLSAVQGGYAAMGSTAVGLLRRAIAKPGQAQPAQAIVGGWYEGDSLAGPQHR